MQLKYYVETAFLYGELEREIFMEYPLAMKSVWKNDCISLGKCIYGLVHAARQYNKKAHSHKEVWLCWVQGLRLAFFKAVKEVMFVIQLLQSMTILVLWDNNEGAIFIASNFTTRSNTNYVNIRYKYANEYVEDG